MNSSAANETLLSNGTTPSMTTDPGFNSTSTLKDVSVQVDMYTLLIPVSVFTVTSVIVLVVMWAWKYRSLSRTIRDLYSEQSLIRPQFKPSANSPPTIEPSITLGEESQDSSSAPVLLRETPESASRDLCSPIGTGTFINKFGLSLQQLIKAGRNGMYFKAKIVRHTCRGHSVVTCKISKEDAPKKNLKREVNIMRKLGTHKNILQLLDWNISDTPCILIMESVSCGTMRSFLQANHEELNRDSDLQCLFTNAAYHIAHAMLHLSSRRVVHCDLALRNIMVNQFPKEVKLTEFGLARDLTHTNIRCNSRKSNSVSKVPIRWYPPEYLRNKSYGFKGDVWSYGILLWEMQTFGSLPYPTMDTPKEVVPSVCSGYRNIAPETCRPEIRRMMRDCWLEDYTQRPSFNDIVTVLENIMETDADYTKVTTVNED